jgi:sarcosine oxidase subunit beta
MTNNRIPRTADVIIVGAGVMGTSLAFHLARRKAGRVVVIEKEHVGSGSSGRSSALIRMHYTYPLEVQLAVKSLEMFQNWEETVGEPGDFRKTGFVRIVPRDQVEDLKQNVEMQRLLGVKVRLINSEDLSEIEPDWFIDDIDVAAYEPDSGYGDGANVAGGFLSRARELGVVYVPKTSVSRVQIDKSHVCGVATAQGEIGAPVVVLATGVWTKILTDEALRFCMY